MIASLPVHVVAPIVSGGNMITGLASLHCTRVFPLLATCATHHTAAIVSLCGNTLWEGDECLLTDLKGH
jgi:hypothetical protein